MSGRAQLFGLALAFSLCLGALVAVAAWYVARYGPAGDGWSFRGNGAISVYFALPAVLAAGGTAIAAHQYGRPWLPLGALAGAVGLALALFDVSLLPLFGPRADQVWTPLMSLAVLVWMIAAPLFLGVPPHRRRNGVLDAAHAVAAALFLAGTFAGLAAAGFIVPAGS